MPFTARAFSLSVTDTSGSAAVHDLARNTAGQHVWINAPPSLTEPCIRNLMACRSRDAHTAACVQIPASAEPLQKLLGACGMHKIMQASVSKQPVEIWHLPPAPLPVARAAYTAEQLTFVFDGQIAGAPARILLDSGATHAFVSKQFAMKHGLRITSSSYRTAQLADGTTAAAILGQVSGKLNLAGFACMTNMLVLAATPPEFDILLGNHWLLRWAAELRFGPDPSVVLHRPATEQRAATTHVLRPRSETVTAPVRSTEPRPSYLSAALTAGQKALPISAKQAQLALRRGAQAQLMWVRPTLVAADAEPDAVSTASSTTVTPPGATPAPTDLQAQIDALNAEFADVYKDVPPGLPPDRGIGHTIPLIPGATPPFKHLYRLSPAELQEVKVQIASLLEKGWIRPSKSPYGAPILFVAKKDGTLRMVQDFRALNAVTTKIGFSMPHTQDLYDKLAGSTVFTSLDLQSGYHQIRITPEDVPKTAFRTPLGHFEYTVLCFGLANAPAVFQTTMQRILAPYLGQFVVVYLDDILIYSKTPAEHVKHLRLVLELLREHKLYAKSSKCEFCKPELRYLGFIVGKEGVKVDPAKVKAVVDWPAPTNVAALRSFLGLANYFRRFMQGYGGIVACLNELTKASVPWNWLPRHQAAFDSVKHSLTHAPVLSLPDPSLPFELIADASLLGIGAVLLQGGKPLAYHSRKFTSAEVNYTTGEQELLAVHDALTEWRCYLEGAKTVLVTDHNPNTYLNSVNTLSRRQARWMEFMARFDYTWLYRPGRINVADPISRNPEPRALAAFALFTVANTDQQPYAGAPPIGDAIVAAYANDPWFAEPRHTQQYQLHDHGFYTRTGNSPDTRQVVVPSDKALRDRIIYEHHSTPMAGHQGRDRTHELVTRCYWWPTVRRDVEDFVARCDSCQRNKHRTGPKPGLLQSLPIPDYPWQHVTMDFIPALPKTKSGYDCIAVFVCRLTKMVHFAATRITVTAEQTAQLLMQNVVRLHGVPETLITDRGPQFRGFFLPALAQLLGTATRMSTAYHPQTDGQTERVNRVLEEMLRAFVAPTPDDWDNLLPAAEFAVNNAYQASVKDSPFFLNYGLQPRMPGAEPLPLIRSVPQAAQRAAALQEALKLAKAAMDAAQQRQQAYYNQNRVEIEYKPGDYVLLSTKKLLAGPNRKLLARWMGPYAVEHMVGNNAVRLALPDDLDLHPTFSVARLKPYVGEPQQPPVIEIQVDNQSIFELEHILDVRPAKKNGRKTKKREFFVKWAGWDAGFNSWEPEENLSPNDVARFLAARSASGL